MRLLHKLRSLTATDRRLLVEALILLMVVRTLLSLFPYPVQRRLLTRCLRPVPATARGTQLPAEQVASLVRRASRLIPSTTCLAQALAAQLLLTRAGHLPTFRIGVAKRREGGIDAHAWVESGGEVVIGGEGIERYTELPGVAAHLPVPAASRLLGDLAWVRR